MTHAIHFIHALIKPRNLGKPINLLQAKGITPHENSIISKLLFNS
jgi:hypothetical protein